MQIVHCKIKERTKGKRKCTSGANCTLQNKRKKGKRKCTSGANCILQNKKRNGKENVHLVQIVHCKIKEREKKMYIWCKMYIAK